MTDTVNDAQQASKRRGRKPKGERAMTAVERARESRYNRIYTVKGHSGKQLSVMLSGEAHLALKELLDFYGDKSQKCIIEEALISMYRRKDLQKPLL